jgi:predicted signal transduction protein with EAL and GGDEF domain
MPGKVVASAIMVDSIGIAESPPCRDLSVLLMQADLAMYAAKQDGGGCWRIVGDTDGERHLNLRNNLGHGLSDCPSRHHIARALYTASHMLAVTHGVQHLLRVGEQP